MKKFSILLLGLILFVTIFVGAQNVVNVDTSGVNSSTENRIENLNDIEQIEEDIKNYSGLNDKSIEEVVVVIGDELNLVEKTALKYAYKKYPELRNVETFKEDSVDLQVLKDSGKTLVFIGGPSQNELAREYLESKDESVLREYNLISGAYDEGAVVLSDRRGFANLERDSVKNSPLTRVMDEQYVPAGAAGISVLLLILLEFGSSYFEGWIERRGGRRGGRAKEVSDKFKFREVVAIVLGIGIFAFSISWMFVGGVVGQSRFLSIFGISILACFLIFGFQEIVRKRSGKKRKTGTEFTLYPLGIITTLVSAGLGNIFGYPGRWLFENKKYSGRIYYSMMILVFALGVLFFLLNLYRPSVFLQVAFTITSTVSLFEFLPFKPLNGREIYKWSPRTWWVTFVIFLPVYVLMNFVL